MSFHGGLIGAVIGSVYFSRKYQTDLMNLTDIISLYAPIGLFFGRLGNFINSELYGLKTSGSWGVIFTKVDEYPRHPSMIYEAFLEGIVLFIILSIRWDPTIPPPPFTKCFKYFKTLIYSNLLQ